MLCKGIVWRDITSYTQLAAFFWLINTIALAVIKNSEYDYLYLWLINTLVLALPSLEKHWIELCLQNSEVTPMEVCDARGAVLLSIKWSPFIANYDYVV